MCITGEKMNIGCRKIGGRRKGHFWRNPVASNCQLHKNYFMSPTVDNAKKTALIFYEVIFVMN